MDTPAVASDRVEVHRSTQLVRWGDMDALGHVNNTLYFRYMEQARLEWLYALVGHDRPYEAPSGPLIVNASCTFLEPIVYPAALLTASHTPAAKSLLDYLKTPAAGTIWEKYGFGLAR